jgi:hypothetical protein
VGVDLEFLGLRSLLDVKMDIGCLLLFLESQERPQHSHEYSRQSRVDHDVVSDQWHGDFGRHTDPTFVVVRYFCNRESECYACNAAEAKQNDGDRSYPDPILSAPFESVPHGVCPFNKEELDQHLSSDIEDQTGVDGCTARSDRA